MAICNFITKFKPITSKQVIGQLTSASLFSISGITFSTAVFWIKAQASSVLSALRWCAACSIICFNWSSLAGCYKIRSITTQKLSTSTIPTSLMSLTRRTELKAFLKLLVIDKSNGSLQVIIAIPAVRFLTMWIEAMRIRTTSGSRAKSCAEYQTSLHSYNTYKTVTP